MVWVKWLARTDDAIDEVHELVHGCDGGSLLGLARRSQPVAKRLDDGVVATSHERWQEQGLARIGVADAADAAASLQGGAGLHSLGCDADEGRQCLGAL